MTVLALAVGAFLVVFMLAAGLEGLVAQRRDQKD